MLRHTRWSVPLAFALSLGCQEQPAAPDLAYGKGGGGAAPRPEIVYRQIERKQIGYYVINADGSAKALVASGAKNGAAPSWSEQGAGTGSDPYRFAWGDADPVTGQGCELFVTDVVVSGSSVTGGPRLHVPTTPKNAAHPDQSLACHIAWSPVGPEVAYATGFLSGVSGGPELWIVNIPPAPAGDRLVYASTKPLLWLGWSRDGSRIAVVERSDDYTIAGDRMLLIDVATGAATTLLALPANGMLQHPEFANQSNDILYRWMLYDCGCTTSNCCPVATSMLYRLPVDAGFLPGAPQPLVPGSNGSWAPDDASFVGSDYTGLFRYTFATGAVSRLVNQGIEPDWR